MLSEIPAPARLSLAPLFEDLPGWHGAAHTVLAGGMGQVYADDLLKPSVAVLKLGFDNLVGGPADHSTIQTVMSFLPPSCFIVVPPGWNQPLERDYGLALQPEHRMAFNLPAEWDQERLRAFSGALPSGFELRRAGAENIDAFAALDRSLVHNFPSLADFLVRGVGFGIEHEGRFVSGCSSYAIGGGKLEIEVDTHPEFQQRGFAAACAAALILHCAETGIEPCWDAANDVSARLAHRLGFIDPRPYTAYYVHPATAADETSV